MERREAFKKIGIMALAGTASLLFFNACTNNETETAVAPISENSANDSVAAPKSAREKLIINRQKVSMVDPQNPTDFELKHTPDLVLGTTDEKGNTSLSVGIGQKGIIHPSTPEHWIDYIKIFVNEQLMVDLQYMNLPIRPYGQFYLQLKKGDIIRVESGCNLHGIYENSITVS